MTCQIIIVIILTFVIHLISTLSYSVRLVGVRTGRIAVSFALFNIMVLISRTSNAFQAPLLAKTIEENIKSGVLNAEMDFRCILLSASFATIIGALLIPTFQRLFSKAVISFSVVRSVPGLLMHGFSKAGISQFKKEFKLPDKRNLNPKIKRSEFPLRIMLSNIIVVAILTVGVLSALYAGYLIPELRTTSSTLSAVINGFATILLFVFIDPYLSILTDDVVAGKFSELLFRKYIVFLVAGRLIGTILAQFFLIPAAKLIAFVAELL